MSDIFNFPPPSPLHRLNVHDNLTINADRWSFAHGYHRQRQSLEYQSLYQPGIVYGLGVKVIDPPAQTRFKDRRWLEVQSGMAIDYQGNFVIVNPEQDRTYRLAVPEPQAAETTVYLIVKYVDPEGLELPKQRERVPEQFRLDETTQLPNPNIGEIELCRIHLSLGEVRLEMPSSPLTPQINQPNMLHRQQAQARSQSYLRIGLLAPSPNFVQKRYNSLARSLLALYPALHISADPINDFSALSHYGALHLQPSHISALGSRGQQSLQQYISDGGTVLFEVEDDSAAEQLQQTLTHAWAVYFEGAQQPAAVDAHHALTTYPFLFGQLPDIGSSKIRLLYSDGILIVVGSLSTAWEAGEQWLTRESIRAAQELATNLLAFCCHRQQLYQLQQ